MELPLHLVSEGPQKDFDQAMRKPVDLRVGVVYWGLLHFELTSAHVVMVITHEGFRAWPCFWVASQNFVQVVPSGRGSPSGHPRSWSFLQASAQLAVSEGSTGVGPG